jgi:O-antigen/teichoic acid export membrane protein
MEPAGLSDTVVRGVGLAGTGFILSQILTLGFYLALARLVSPREFGLFTAGSLVAGLGVWLAESGLVAALIHRRDRIEEAANTALIASVAAGVAYSLLALAAAPVMGIVFHSATVGRIAAVMSGVLFLGTLQIVPEAILQRRFSFVRQAVIKPLEVVALGASAVIACANGLGPWGLVIGYYASATTRFTLSWAFVGWRPRLRLASFAMWKELVQYGRFVVASNFLLRVAEQIPVLLLGSFVGKNPLGQYRYASRVATTPIMVVIQGASYVLFPALARISANAERFRAACLRSLRMMCAVAFPLGMSLVPLGVPASVLFFGDVWKDAGYSAVALAPFPVAGAVVAFATEVFKASGRPAILTKTNLVMLIAGSVCMVALLPFNLVGVSAGFSIGAIAGAAYALWSVARLLELPVRSMVNEMWPQALAATFMAGVLLAAELLVVHADSHGTVVGIVLLGAEAALGLVLYSAALFTIAPESARDLASVVSRLMRRGSDQGESDSVQSASVTSSRAG